LKLCPLLGERVCELKAADHTTFDEDIADPFSRRALRVKRFVQLIARDYPAFEENLSEPAARPSLCTGWQFRLWWSEWALMR
jgi:hypothetical protein